MKTETFIGFFDLCIFIGVFQGIILSWFYITKGSKESKAFLYQGVLILFLSLAIFEELLNNTGYIVKVLPISNYGESLNFTFGPLFYLYIRSSLKPDEKRKDWPHFILALLWLAYMTFYFIQSNELKYNSYVDSKHPDWASLDVNYHYQDDPLKIRHYTSELLSIHFIGYIVFSILALLKKLKASHQSFFRIHDEKLKVLRNTTYHFITIILIFISVKIYFGNDVGDYFIATYISFMFLLSIFQVLNKTSFFNQPHSFLEFPKLKYTKSSLTEEGKENILVKIKAEMETNSYFSNNMASLSDLAKRLHESQHHVSQVINEKMNKNFFELLAWYRIEEAKKIIKNDKDSKITVEELAEIVGYNSKSSFNNAFKKLTSKTPSEFRKSEGNS